MLEEQWIYETLLSVSQTWSFVPKNVLEKEVEQMQDL